MEYSVEPTLSKCWNWHRATEQTGGWTRNALSRDFRSVIIHTKKPNKTIWWTRNALSRDFRGAGIDTNQPSKTVGRTRNALIRKCLGERVTRWAETVEVLQETQSNREKRLRERVMCCAETAIGVGIVAKQPIETYLGGKRVIRWTETVEVLI